MKKPSSFTKSMLAAAMVGALGSGVTAGEISSDLSAKGGGVDPVDEPSIFDQIWGLAHLYSNPDGFWLTDLKLIGRYQLQYANVDADQGTYSDWESRRWRLGAEARILGGDWKLKGEINIDPDFNPFYAGIEEAYLAYAPSKDFTLAIGKVKPKWSYEWATSSRKILTFERSLLVNQLNPEKASGITASGSVDSILYHFGIFSGDITDDEFGRFDQGIFAVGSLGYDYSARTGLDNSVVRFDWLYNGDSTNTAAAPYRHSFSLNNSIGTGPWNLATDLIFADGFENDAWGVVLLPSYDITDKLQVVGRYHYANGDNDSLRAQSRYERRGNFLTDSGFGEDYHSFYAGLNYYIYEHKLKLMTGIEYSELDDKAGDGGDYKGWTYFAGLRLYF